MVMKSALSLATLQCYTTDAQLTIWYLVKVAIVLVLATLFRVSALMIVRATGRDLPHLMMHYPP